MALDVANFHESNARSNQTIGGQLYTVISPGDNLATIKGSNYFNAVASIVNKFDMIIASGSDNTQLLQVESNDGTTVVVRPNPVT